jgi:hypothetical protein
MNAELLWKAFAVALGAAALYGAAAGGESFSASNVAALLFKALTVVGLVGFAWRRAILWQRLWKAVLVIQLLITAMLLVQIVSGFVRFSDAALLLALLQATLISLFFAAFTLIGLFLYAWSPIIWVEKAGVSAERSS